MYFTAKRVNGLKEPYGPYADGYADGFVHALREQLGRGESLTEDYRGMERGLLRLKCTAQVRGSKGWGFVTTDLFVGRSWLLEVDYGHPNQRDPTSEEKALIDSIRLKGPVRRSQTGPPKQTPAARRA